MHETHICLHSLLASRLTLVTVMVALDSSMEVLCGGFIECFFNVFLV